MALALLMDPDLRLRMCHLEEIMRCRQAERGYKHAESAENNLDLRGALGEPSFASMFFLDTSVQEQEWGLQVSCRGASVS